MEKALVLHNIEKLKESLIQGADLVFPFEPTIAQFISRFARVGSRVTCNPPVMDTDEDILVLLPDMDALYAAGKILRNSGWELGGSGDCEDAFESWTKGEMNLILTAQAEFYGKFWCATTVCMRLNLMDKNDRKAVFRAVLYAETCRITPGSEPTCAQPLPLPLDDGETPF